MPQLQPRLKPLTDRQIDVYVLQGKYGEERKREWIRSLRQGSRNLAYLHPRIRKGEFGPDAQAALGTRKQKRKRNHNNDLSNTSIDKLLKKLGLLS